MIDMCMEEKLLAERFEARLRLYIAESWRRKKNRIGNNQNDTEESCKEENSKYVIVSH